MTLAQAQGLSFMAAALIGATAVTFVLSPFAIRFARALRAVDLPRERRRSHGRRIPRTGGLAVAVAFVAVSAIAVVLNNVMGAVPALSAVPQGELAAILGGAVLAALIGYLDDRRELPARWHLLGQVAVAVVAVAAGIRIGFIDNPFRPGSLLFAEPLAMLISVLWIVGVMNSINFIDGLDGLSAGVSVIAAVTLGVISLTTFRDPAVALLCAVLAGALAGLLPWNFHPARLFIGTSGVFVVGYVLAVLSILGTAKVALALLVLGVPIIDTFWTVVRRLASGRSAFAADRGHLHHRLLDLGLTHRGAVVLIYGLCVALALTSLVLSRRGHLYAFLAIVVAGGLVLFLMARWQRDPEGREALEASSYPIASDGRLLDDVRQGGSSLRHEDELLGGIDPATTGG